MKKKRMPQRLNVKQLIDPYSRSNFWLRKEKVGKNSFWVLRENGRFLSRRSAKGFSKDDVIAQVRKTRTLSDDSRYTALSNVVERTKFLKTYDSSSVNAQKMISDKGSSVRVSARRDAMYVVSIAFKNGYEVTRTSDKFNVVGGVRAAKKQAWRRALNEVGEKYSSKYDEDEGVTALENKNFVVREGIIYYTKRQR